MKTYTVTLENYSGKCKKVEVIAVDKFDAMAKAHKSGWIPVSVA